MMRNDGRRIKPYAADGLEMTATEWLSYREGLARRREIEHPPPVLTKADFARRYRAGEFGNASPSWETPEAFAASDWYGRGSKQLFHLRSKTPGGPTYYNLLPTEAVGFWEREADPAAFYCSAMAPEHRKVLQGEIVLLDPQNEPTHAALGSSGLYLMYNTERLPMREGMAAEYSREGYQRRMNAEGCAARIILLRYLDPNSLDWLSVLLDRYPGHVIEFSTYETEWGTVPGFRTVFWECRKY